MRLWKDYFTSKFLFFPFISDNGGNQVRAIYCEQLPTFEFPLTAGSLYELSNQLRRKVSLLLVRFAEIAESSWSISPL